MDEQALPATSPPGSDLADRKAARARLWRRIALTMLVVPLIGFVATVAVGWRYGVSALDIGLLVLMFTLSVGGVSVGYHRLLAHHAFQTKPWIRSLMAIGGSMAVQGPVILYVALHRRHHKFSDSPGDPHSPHLHGADGRGRLRGLLYAHFGWMFEYQEMKDWISYAPELFRDEAIRRVDKRYFLWVALGLVIPGLLGGLLSWSLWGALTGFLWGGIGRVFLGNQSLYCINSFCHSFGFRTYPLPDHSVNNLWLSLPTMGESFQNNHHAYPTAAKTGFAWWQFDPGGWIIGILAMAGLVWDVKPGPGKGADAVPST